MATSRNAHFDASDVSRQLPALPITSGTPRSGWNTSIDVLRLALSDPHNKSRHWSYAETMHDWASAR